MSCDLFQVKHTCFLQQTFFLFLNLCPLFKFMAKQSKLSVKKEIEKTNQTKRKLFDFSSSIFSDDMMSGIVVCLLRK